MVSSALSSSPAAAAAAAILRRRPTPPLPRVFPIPLLRLSETLIAPRIAFPSPARLRQSPLNAMASSAAAAAAAAATKGSKELIVFGSEEDLAVSLAKYTAELSEKFVRERGPFPSSSPGDLSSNRSGN
uniref:Uncharacterized protein n=1 Tax=Ananas comosus var. bracteatus TaxID=296719 RepID=A0A6V7PIR0_ANACO|nr:unnamed protein product [Ananas comosus var. bracteatus]